MSDLSFASSETTDALPDAMKIEFFTKILYYEEPIFISDEATIWDIWSGDLPEILSRCSLHYGIPVTKKDTAQSFWKFLLVLNQRREWAKHDTNISIELHRELWTSWASMLRVYAAAHGMASTHHAVVEVGANEIVLRVDQRWIRFVRESMTTSEGGSVPFSIAQDGTVSIAGVVDEMDMAAEGVARTLLLG